MPLVCAKADYLVTVTIEAPPVNALDPELIDALRDAFEAVPSDPSIRAVVLTASGSRAFCGGVDLRTVRKISDGQPMPDPGLHAREMLEAIYTCPVPVIAALNGPAVGAGVSLLAMCDFAVATVGTWIQTPELDVGLLGAFSHLRRLVGDRRARSLYLSGERCAAEELLARDVVSAVYPLDELQEAARLFARRFIGKSPIAIRLAKEAMIRTEVLGIREAYRLEQDYTTRLLTFEDATEAQLARTEGRKPVWKGR